MTKTGNTVIRILLILLFLVPIFLIAGGTILLLAGVETTGAIICIILGVLTLGILGAAIFLTFYPGNRIASGIVVGILAAIAGSIALAVLSSMIYTMILQPCLDIEHYRQVWQNPVSVSAVVTRHNSYDNDGDKDYRSCVSYTYNNTHYQDYPYENRDKEEQLTPIGTEVTIQISPKDPSRQIAELKSHGKMLPFSIVLIPLVIAALYMLLQRLMLTKAGADTLSAETIQKDTKLLIRSRMLRPFLLQCIIIYSFIYWRYSFALGWLPLIVAAVSCAGWLFCMYTTIRDYRCVESENYTIRQDVLINKKEITDADGTTYVLEYRNNKKTWTTSADLRAYNRACIGDTVLAVYLPNKKKPLLHYDRNGNAR